MTLWCLHPNGTSIWTGETYDPDDPSQTMVAKATGVTMHAVQELDRVVEAHNTALAAERAAHEATRAALAKALSAPPDADLVALAKECARDRAELAFAALEAIPAIEHYVRSGRERETATRMRAVLARMTGIALPTRAEDLNDPTALARWEAIDEAIHALEPKEV